MSDKIQQAFEAHVRKRMGDDLHPSFNRRSETGQMYAAKWMQDQFRDFEAGYLAAEQVRGSEWREKYDALVLSVMRGSHREARDMARPRFVEMHPEEKGHAAKVARQHATTVSD